MRLTWLIFLLLSLPLLGGCSQLICNAGVDLQELTTRQAVHKQFGVPEQTGVHEDGCQYEQVTTRQKIAHPLDQGMYGMAVAMTYGLCELICFPYQLCQACSEAILGQRVRFVYDADGKVINIIEYDHGLWGLGRPAYPK